jgi:hypothetical protein
METEQLCSKAILLSGEVYPTTRMEKFSMLANGKTTDTPDMVYYTIAEKCTRANG